MNYQGFLGGGRHLPALDIGLESDALRGEKIKRRRVIGSENVSDLDADPYNSQPCVCKPLALF